MKKVIVTGANGFIGSALVKELIENDVIVYAVVRNNSSYPSFFDNNEKIHVLTCSMEEYDKLPSLLNNDKIDVLFHLAWAGTSGDLRGDYQTQLDNVRYSCDLIKICKDIYCDRIVFAASIMEYEIQSLIETEIPPGINTIYSTAKMTADYMIKALAASENVQYIRGIISNVYGPGELSPRIINTSLRKLLKGEHCSFSAGEQIYDFIYIADAAKVFYEIGEKGINNKTYYIGSLNPRPLKEFILEMRDLVNSGIEIGLGELPFCGVSLTYKEFDIFAVRDDTGFVSQVSFSEGIKRTIEWIKSKSIQ